jgi:hypothetical protein
MRDWERPQKRSRPAVRGTWARPEQSGRLGRFYYKPFVELQVQLRWPPLSPVDVVLDLVREGAVSTAQQASATHAAYLRKFQLPSRVHDPTSITPFVSQVDNRRSTTTHVRKLAASDAYFALLAFVGRWVEVQVVQDGRASEFLGEACAVARPPRSSSNVESTLVLRSRPQGAVDLLLPARDIRSIWEPSHRSASS